LRGINYPAHYQKSPVCFRCVFGFCQRSIILWPIPNESINARIGLFWLALFQFLNSCDYLVA
jgi:hypothetical protein